MPSIPPHGIQDFLSRQFFFKVSIAQLVEGQATTIKASSSIPTG